MQRVRAKATPVSIAVREPGAQCVHCTRADVWPHGAIAALAVNRIVSRRYIPDEDWIVSRSDALVEPAAVVIEVRDALIALATVLSAGAHWTTVKALAVDDHVRPDPAVKLRRRRPSPRLCPDQRVRRVERSSGDLARTAPTPSLPGRYVRDRRAAMGERR